MHVRLSGDGLSEDYPIGSHHRHAGVVATALDAEYDSRRPGRSGEWPYSQGYVGDGAIGSGGAAAAKCGSAALEHGMHKSV
jgi:hypothetical protein